MHRDTIGKGLFVFNWMVIKLGRGEILCYCCYYESKDMELRNFWLHKLGKISCQNKAKQQSDE